MKGTAFNAMAGVAFLTFVSGVRTAEAACALDVDGSGTADVATDGVYIARHLLGLPPVPGSFRVLDPSIQSDATIAAAVNALGSSLDVDTNGDVDVATDIVYIARRLLGLPPVPANFRALDPTIPPDATIAAHIDALCSSVTPTATHTSALAATATPSLTPTVTATHTPTPTATPTLGLTIGVAIAPGGGTSGSCRGTCTGGGNNGLPCGLATDCPGGTCAGPKACVGGPYDGEVCVVATQCSGCDPNRICTAAGTPLACCTGNTLGTCPLAGSCAIVQGNFGIRVPLNGVCLPRTAPPGDVDCTTNAECHICVGGGNNGKTCKTATDCPSGNCSGSGTCQLAKLDLVVGTENLNHEIPLTIPQSSLVLNPAIISGIGTVCVAAGGDGAGLMDCDGGHANLNATLNRDHNTTGKVCLSGTNKGLACTKNSDCPSGTCNSTCSGGTKAGNACTSNADCPAALCIGNSGSANGLPDDPTCTNTFVQPDGSTSFACLEGTKQCSGGTNDGVLCTVDGDCLGGGTCAFCNIGTGGGPHPAVCNSPQQVVQSGNFAAGDTALALPLAITIHASNTTFGPDQLACTPDDTAVPSPPVTVLLSTGTNTVNIYDAANVAANTIGPGATCAGLPCVAQITGHAGSCTNLTAGSVSGVTFGGGFPAIDSPIGDIATVFQFAAQ